MSVAAWSMMLLTWTVVIGFTIYFFLKILLKDHLERESDNDPGD